VSVTQAVLEIPKRRKLLLVNSKNWVTTGRLQFLACSERPIRLNSTQLPAELSWVGSVALNPALVQDSYCYKLEEPIIEILYGAKNAAHAFGYNRRKWTDLKQEYIVARWPCYIDFGRDPRSSDSLRGSQFFWSGISNARFRRFSVGQIYEIWTQQRRSVSPCKLSKQKFKNCTVRGRFYKKTQKFLENF